MKTNCLTIADLNVTLTHKNILKNISLNLQEGEIGCLLGPSGCGKTTLLRSVAGFINPTEGTISINGDIASSNKHIIAVEKRNIGMVFQDFALFPHLTVYDNIGFGLKNLKQSKQAINQRVSELLALIELEDKKDSFPHELSGGQQQRIALARALAPKPSIILLDEPFSSIDKSMRDVLAFKLRTILKAENATAIMVTHDQSEAYAIADKIGVMNQGQLLQWDTPIAIYNKPATQFVASFIGESTFIQATPIEPKQIQTVFGQFSQNDIVNAQTPLVQNLQLLVRPNNIHLDATSSIKANVIHQFFKGGNFIYLLELPNKETVYMNAPLELGIQVGTTIGINTNFSKLLVF